MNILFLGDIVGRPGRRIVKELLPGMINDLSADFVVANGENAAGGNGITKPVASELFDSGINILTMGNHVWDKIEVFDFIDAEPRIIRPANYPPGTPGRGKLITQGPGGVPIGILNLSGRVFLSDLDCPFRSAELLIQEMKQNTKIILVDFHAEATSEKVAFGWYLAGKVSAVLGTHTHVQTADYRVLPGGTAYITDVGMTGPRDSVLGVKKEAVIKKFVSHLPVRFEVASGTAQLNGVLLKIEEDSGQAVHIEPVVHYLE